MIGAYIPAYSFITRQLSYFNRILTSARHHWYGWRSYIITELLLNLPTPKHAVHKDIFCSALQTLMFAQPFILIGK
jgi:hypothetical protein